MIIFLGIGIDVVFFPYLCIVVQTGRIPSANHTKLMA